MLKSKNKFTLLKQISFIFVIYVYPYMIYIYMDFKKIINNFRKVKTFLNSIFNLKCVFSQTQTNENVITIFLDETV